MSCRYDWSSWRATALAHGGLNKFNPKPGAQSDFFEGLTPSPLMRRALEGIFVDGRGAVLVEADGTCREVSRREMSAVDKLLAIRSIKAQPFF
jgi:hypothetical protein